MRCCVTWWWWWWWWATRAWVRCVCVRGVYAARGWPGLTGTRLTGGGRPGGRTSRGPALYAARIFHCLIALRPSTDSDQEPPRLPNAARADATTPARFSPRPPAFGAAARPAARPARAPQPISARRSRSSVPGSGVPPRHQTRARGPQPSSPPARHAARAYRFAASLRCRVCSALCASQIATAGAGTACARAILPTNPKACAGSCAACDARLTLAQSLRGRCITHLDHLAA